MFGGRRDDYGSAPGRSVRDAGRRTGIRAVWAGSRLAATGSIAFAVVVALMALVPLVATATTQTKFYSASGSGGDAFVGVANTVTVMLGNDSSSKQTFGSAELTFSSVPPSAVQVGALAAGWSGQVLSNGNNAVVLVTSQKGHGVPPGGSLTVPVKLTTTAAGTVTIDTQVKQSNNFSGTGNDFILLHSSGLTINVVAVSLRFQIQPPSTVKQSIPQASPAFFSYFCVSVQLYNANVPLAAGGFPITIRYAGTADPGLFSNGVAVPAAGIAVATDATGLATFCGPGFAATIVGSGYALTASSPAALTPITSTPFAVTPTCNGSCTNNVTSQTTGITAVVSANDPGGVFQLFTAFGQGVTLNCDSAVTNPGSPVDPLSVVAQPLTGTVSGTVTLTFPASLVNAIPRNDDDDEDSPVMPVCVGAKKHFPVKADASTGPAPDLFQGLLFDCNDPTYQSLVASGNFPLQICVQSRTMIAGGAERIVVFTSDLSDPHYV